MTRGSDLEGIALRYLEGVDSWERRKPRLTLFRFPFAAPPCSQYQVASSAVSAGLSPGATIGAVLLGHFVISLACAATGYIGCRYGINYPSVARTAFGIHGTYIAVICRGKSKLPPLSARWWARGAHSPTDCQHYGGSSADAGLCFQPSPPSFGLAHKRIRVDNVCK